MRQFSLFAWTHVALLIVVTQSYLIIQNMFEGLIWFILPIMMVVINDIMAYMFGFFLGRTPLIKLSPKKTWEGYLGGGVATVIMSMMLAHYLCKSLYLVCPIGMRGLILLTQLPTSLFLRIGDHGMIVDRHC